ncbi:DUF6412 domain-containing protein [Streptomyces xanthii]|uniref:Uncharacterized protein n=1 Tax=Streptomyces xanthii TaxID=2768069 RepID=A0A7H1BBA8_9ACTN|nr:DUF6412 domain-containing protein [Streptomyces xanthii]QNS06013.1 hypothetical protein IAG42_22140 [Streptomyces xanthii]
MDRKNTWGAVLRPVALLLFLLVEAVVVDTGSLAGAVALAATAAVGSALTVCSVLAARSAPAVPPTRVRTAIRDREQRTAFLPQRDPDARGRTRPRAPGRLVPTAC